MINSPVRVNAQKAAGPRRVVSAHASVFLSWTRSVPRERYSLYKN